MFHAVFIVSRVQECLCWGWLLGLRIIGPSSFTRFCFKTYFKTKHGEMQTTNTFAQSCVPSKKNSLGPLQCLGHAGAMKISNDIFMIHTFPKNPGHLDLKLVEGKRSGSWRTSTTWVWPANGFLYTCIGCIGLWTVRHLWYSNIFLFSSLEGMRQRTPRNQCMFFLDVLKLLLFATCPSPRPLRPGEKSQLNLTFHLEGATQIASETFSFISSRLSIP